MSLSKKDLQEMIRISVKNTIIKEVKPLIVKTIREEFYKIIDEASSLTEQKVKSVESTEDISMVRLLDDNTKDENDTEDTDEIRNELEEKMFGGQFGDVLSQTKKQYQGRSISRESSGVIPMTEQKEIIVKSDSVPMTPTNKKLNSADLASKLGYGEGFNKVGSDLKVPGVDLASSKKPSVKNLINNNRDENTPVKVLLPSTTPDGKPINFDKIPQSIAKNIMKNYKGLLDKSGKIIPNRSIK